MAEMKFNWVDNPTASGIAECNTDVLNDCLMHLKYDNGGGGAGLQLFDTILKDHVLTYEETKGLALQGTYVYKEALAGSRYGYPDFYNKVLEEYNQATTTEIFNGVTVKVHTNGHKFYNIADKEAIDEFFNTMGSAWFYGVDTANERIFLPRNNYFEQVTGGVSEVGQSVEAGLPNITGTLQSCGWESDVATGAFYNNGSKKGASGSDQRTIVNLDASRSSAVYGNSDTVQPNAVKKLLYICVGNTTNYEGVTDVVNQGMEILEQINEGFVHKDSMQEVPCVIETYVNGFSWYRIWSDNWCEQGGDIANDDVTITLLKPFANTNYTCICVCSYSRVNENFYIDSKTTTTFHARYASGGTWFACGQLAEGEY